MEGDENEKRGIEKIINIVCFLTIGLINRPVGTGELYHGESKSREGSTLCSGQQAR